MATSREEYVVGLLGNVKSWIKQPVYLQIYQQWAPRRLHKVVTKEGPHRTRQWLVRNRRVFVRSRSLVGFGRCSSTEASEYQIY